MLIDEFSGGVVTSLNADVVGYSRLMADDQEATSESMGRARDAVERCVDEAGGLLVNFVGDNFMAVFGDSVSGVRVAIRIATELEAVNAELPEARWLRFRMGMDRGPVAVTGDRFEGDALNIAARLQALAQPGGLLVSAEVYRDLDEPALRFRPEGARSLKNIPEPVEVYVFADLPTDGAGLQPSTALSLDLPTVAVLPIHAEGLDDQAAAAASLIRSDILHALAKVPLMVVIDADTTRAEPTAPGARYMLETGIHQFGDVIRVFATLFDVTSLNVVKSHKVTASVSDVLMESEDLAEEIRRAIEVELVVGAPAGLYAELDDPAAIEKIYLGWFHLRSDTPEGWQRAMDLFDEVAASHPHLPYGWVLAGFGNWLGAASGWTDPAQAFDAALKQARMGGETGDVTGMAKAVEAAVLMSTGRVDDAVEVMKDLEIVRPTCDVTYGLEGSLKRYLGEWEEAVSLMDRAMRLTGLNKPWYPTVKACSLFVGSRLEQAISVAESVLEYQPHNLEALLVLTAAQAELGLDRRAAATVERIRSMHPSLDVEEWLSRNPYQDPATIDRWQQDLRSAGLISAT